MDQSVRKNQFVRQDVSGGWDLLILLIHSFLELTLWLGKPTCPGKIVFGKLVLGNWKPEN